jgi:hypothetical protein
VLSIYRKENPVGVIITVIAGLAAGIIALWNTNEGFRDAVTNIWNGIKDTAVNVFNGIVAFLSKWGLDILTVFAPFIGIPIQIYKHWDGIKEFFGNLFQDIGNIVNNIKSKIINMFTGIKIPHISVDIKWGGPGNAIPYPSFDVNWFAKGGVFNNPAIIGVGEAGKEAVMPLENNTGWISDLASELTNRMGSSSGGNYSFVIPLYIDGKEVARASVKYTSEELARMNRNSKMAFGGA